MGFGSYFKAKEPVAPASAAAPVATPSVIEKREPTASPEGSFQMELQPPASKFNSARNSRNSFSNRSTHSSAFLDDIKHEVMVNYLYQQQCSSLWVSDGSGAVEGVLLRKAKNMYMACPPQLGDSPFAAACAALNVQVSLLCYFRSL
jgi:hypothetical protein